MCVSKCFFFSFCAMVGKSLRSNMMYGVGRRRQSTHRVCGEVHEAVGSVQTARSIQQTCRGHAAGFVRE